MDKRLNLVSAAAVPRPRTPADKPPDRPQRHDDRDPRLPGPHQLRMNEASWRAHDLLRAYASRDRAAIVEHRHEQPLWQYGSGGQGCHLGRPTGYRPPALAARESDDQLEVRPLRKREPLQQQPGDAPGHRPSVRPGLPRAGGRRSGPLRTDGARVHGHLRRPSARPRVGFGESHAPSAARGHDRRRKKPHGRSAENACAIPCRARRRDLARAASASYRCSVAAS